MAGIKKVYLSFRKGNQNGISSKYDIRCDPGLGVGKTTIGWTLCACSCCIEKLDLNWDKTKKTLIKIDIL